MPELAAAFFGYVDAVPRRAAEMRLAYARCEVSETELREAIREEAYLRASIAFAVVPAVGLIGTVAARSRRMLRVLGETPDDLDDAATRRRLTERILVPTLPRGFRQIGSGDVDWAAGSVKERGLSYERSLADRVGDDLRGIWLEREFPDNPGVDFSNFETAQATTVKTLDLNVYTYRVRSSQIYGTLNQYLRDLADYDGGRGIVQEDEVMLRTLNLALPEALRC